MMLNSFISSSFINIVNIYLYDKLDDNYSEKHWNNIKCVRLKILIKVQLCVASNLFSRTKQRNKIHRIQVNKNTLVNAYMKRG